MSSTSTRPSRDKERSKERNKAKSARAPRSPRTPQPASRSSNKSKNKSNSKPNLKNSNTGSVRVRKDKDKNDNKKKKHAKSTMSVNVLPPTEQLQESDVSGNSDDEKGDEITPIPETTNNTSNPSRGGLLSKLHINIGQKNQRSTSLTSPLTPNMVGATPLAGVIPFVSAVGIYANRNLILKVFSEDGMETAFRAAYKGFSNQCLDFLKETDNNRRLEIKTFDIGNSYSMFKSEVGDKELVFLMYGVQDHGYPVVNTLHQLITTISDNLRPDKDGQLTAPSSTRPTHRPRQQSQIQTFQGLSSIEEVFRTMDLEGNGEIDVAEFQTGLLMLGVEWSDKQINKIFNQIDTDNVGKISYSSFMRFMMQPTNKKDWKELKRAINGSIALPSYKQILKDDIDPDEFRKKLSQVEKLIHIMEQAIIQECEDDKEERIWRNKVNSHKEFVRLYQDVVGKAMGEENLRLKKRLSEMENEHRRASEMNLGASPRLSSPRNSERRSVSTPRTPKGGNVDNEALIARLRRENQELKRKVKAKDKEMGLLKVENLRKDKPTTPTRRGSTNVDPEQLEKTINKLRKELKDAKRERDELRQENKEMDAQLTAASDKLAIMGRQGGTDDAILAQLQRAKKEAKAMRSERNELRDETVKLKNIDASLRNKMSKLTKKLMDVDDKMAKQVFDASDVDNMLNVLVDQLTDMAGKYEVLLREYERLKKELDTIKGKHAKEKAALKAEIEQLKEEMKANRDKVDDLKTMVAAKDQIIEGLQQKLRETDTMYEENKKLKRDLADREDELQAIRVQNEQLQAAMAEEQDKTKQFQKQVKMIVKMPTSANWNKQVSRLHKIFNRLDKNKDNKLDFTEFAAGAEELGFGSMEYEQKAAFDDMDKDGDGFVVFEDFKDACMRIMHGNEKTSDAEWAQVRTLLTKPPGHWSNEDVGHWLSTIGMDQYTDNFKDDNVDGKTLLAMNNDDLRGLGVTKKGHNRKILKELEDLKKRDDVITNLQYENDRLRDELNEMKTNGPTWDAVKTLQMRVRGLEGQLRQERHAREQIMYHVKDELKNDSRFNSLDPNEEDMMAEIALLKGAIADTNQKLKDQKKKVPKSGSAYENDAKVEDALDNENIKPIGRFLQKWYVLANHSTQYWVSRTNKEIAEQAELWKQEKIKNGTDNMSVEEAVAQGKSLEQTEALNWILYDARRDRIVQEVRMRGRGEANDPKNVQIQMGVSLSGPWTTVADAHLARSPNEQIIGGFKAESRFWRVCFMSNHGEEDPDAPRWCMYEVQFWGPLDDDPENEHFVIE